MAARVATLTPGEESLTPYAKHVFQTTHFAYCWNFFPPVSAKDTLLPEEQEKADNDEFGRFDENHDALQRVPAQLRERQAILTAKDVDEATKKKLQQELANLSSKFEAWHKEHAEIYAKISDAWSWE
ncbi:MAG: hypothetical protein Q9169_002699 [Polycauliona sp. 2 TL-2023]